MNEPSAVAWLLPRVSVSTLRDAPLRAILQACYDLQAEGQSPGYENLMVRLDDPAVRALATDLIASSALSMPDLAPLSEGVRPAPWTERLEPMLIVLAERERTSPAQGSGTSPRSNRSTVRPGCLSCNRIRISTSHHPAAGFESLMRLDPWSRASGRILDGQVG